MPELPSSPGVYCFENEAKKRLYIGKTIHFKTRFRQHIKNALEGDKSFEFLSQAKRVTIYPVRTDLESILLEARLIRLYKPKYNAIAKDDKSLLYIKVSKDEYPRLIIVRRSDLTPSDEYFGPFTSGLQTQLIYRLCRRIFKFCSNPPRTGNKGRACFYYHLKLCSGACVGKETAAEYRMKIGMVKRFLNGRSKGLIKLLQRQIKRLTKEQRFEQAAEERDIFRALEGLVNSGGSFTQMISGTPQSELGLKELNQILLRVGLHSNLERIEGYDMSTLGQEDSVGVMVVFTLGAADKSEYRKFKVRWGERGDPHTMSEVLSRRLEHGEWQKPDLILLDGGKPQLSVVAKVVNEDIALVALAKKEELLYARVGEGEVVEIRLPKRSWALRLVQQVRDEAHRFSTTYQKKLRNKRMGIMKSR